MRYMKEYRSRMVYQVDLGESSDVVAQVVQVAQVTSGSKGAGGGTMSGMTAST